MELLSPWVDKARMKKVASYIPPQSRVLDVGCGSADLVPFLPDDCPYVGVDHDSAVIASDKKRFPNHFFRDLEADSIILPFNRDAFDVVVMAAVLEYMKNPRILLSEVARVVKSDGLVIATSMSSTGGVVHGLMAACKLLKSNSADALAENYLDQGKLSAFLPMTGLRLEDAHTFELGLNQVFILKKEPRRE